VLGILERCLGGGAYGLMVYDLCEQIKAELCLQIPKTGSR